ncbi:MAG: hypothetical protein JNJ89_12120 [Rubrivivax sp.]|nr:hypothetical protein [Rubrivivax sp.]
MTHFTIRVAIRHTGLALASAICLALPAQAQPEEFRRALQAYEDCHWPQAFEGFARLADAGDAEAARIAALMARHGPALYGRAFEVQPPRLARWRDAAVVALLAAR